MTWSLQLTFWALPPLLAVLMVLRDLGYLLPRRREHGILSLAVLSAVTGLWALVSLVAVSTPGLEEGLILERSRYLFSALAPPAWAYFALRFARRRVHRPAMFLLYGLTASTLGITLWDPSRHFLVQSAHLSPLGGVVGLQVVHGWWHWVHLGVRLAALVGGSAVLVSYLSRQQSGHRAAAAALGAALLALSPGAVQLAAAPGASWADLSATGFALGTSLLVAGLVRPRLRALGPVARTLVMDELPDPIVVMDGRGRIVDVNRAADIRLGLRPYGDVPLELGTLWARSSREGYTPGTLSLPVTDGDTHELRTFEVRLARLGDSRGPGRSALLLRDVTDRDRAMRESQKANAELERLANTDPLTGLANRRHFMEALDREVERADRYGRPLSLVLLDLDHFKQVNDVHGHAAGDEVLRQAARVLQGVCRDVDLAARLGGEELALLLPETTTGGARTVADRTRERMAAVEQHGPHGNAFRVTASLGVATLAADIRSGEALLQRADEALYRAKEAGRNRVEVAGAA